MAEPTRDPCPLCEATDVRALVVGYDRMHGTPRDFPYVRCARCGLARQDPLPAPDEIPGFYADDYAPHAGAPKPIRDKWVNRMARRYYYDTDSVGRSPMLRAVFHVLSNRVLPSVRAPRGENRVLDVGCGAGDLLLRYRELGWSVKGVEISPNGAATARERGLDVHPGTIFDAPFEPRAFDLVILSHVIEHVLEPARFLARCGEFLADGGLLVCSTPNAAALGLSLFGSCWYPLDAPRHLMLFDPRTIRLLGERAGLRAVRVASVPEPRMYAESRHYARTQGRGLPADLDERRRVVDASTGAKDEHAGFRKLVTPLAAAASLLGRGEILEAEFVPAR